MLGALEQLMRYHPASRIGRWEPRRSDPEAFEDLEGRHVRRRQEYKPEPVWMLGEVAVAAATVVLFCGVLAAMVRLGADVPDTAQQPLATPSDLAGR